METIILDLQVILHQLKLLAHRLQAVSHLDVMPHDLCKHLCKLLNLRLLLYSRLHTDCLKRIVQKVRIDLACQHLKFNFLLAGVDLFLLHLFRDNAVHQLLNIRDHHIQIQIKLRDLILALQTLRDMEITARRLVHLVFERIDSRAE